MPEETNQNKEQNAPDTPKHHKWLWPLVVVLVLVAIGVSAWAVYNKQVNKNTVSNVEVFDTEKETTDEADSLSNWQTYRNEELGFEVKYPTQLEFDQYGSEDGTVLTFEPRTDDAFVVQAHNRNGNDSLIVVNTEYKIRNIRD